MSDEKKASMNQARQAAADDDDDEMIMFKYERFLDKEKPELGKEKVEENWSTDLAKLLYMLSRYGKCALTPDDVESWIRQLPLAVLMFEGITAGVLDFDYAPASYLISQGGISRRVWLNISQEGKSAIDDLREKGLLNALKLSSEDFQPITAYQVRSRRNRLRGAPLPRPTPPLDAGPGVGAGSRVC